MELMVVTTDLLNFLKAHTSHFVQHPDNAEEIQWGVTHAGNGGEPVTRGTMQHVAFNVDDLDELLQLATESDPTEFRYWVLLTTALSSRCTSLGPEGLSLEICVGSNIDADAWIDPEVSELAVLDAQETKISRTPASMSNRAAAS